MNGTLTGVKFLDGREVLGMDTVPSFTLTLNPMKKAGDGLRARAMASDGKRWQAQFENCQFSASIKRHPCHRWRRKRRAARTHPPPWVVEIAEPRPGDYLFVLAGCAKSFPARIRLPEIGAFFGRIVS